MARTEQPAAPVAAQRDRRRLPRVPTDDVTRIRNAGDVPVTDDAPHVLKSRFVLEDALGSGGMGTVYRAKDLRKVEARDRDPYLAIKVLNARFREHPDAFIALQREAARSQSLSHPNIVSIFDFDKHDDLPFMTMELLRGDELAELLKRYPQGLPQPLAWPVIECLCSAMRHAHAEGLIHADLKPGNVFVLHSGQAKVLDFGLARAVQANLQHGVLQTREDLHDAAFNPDELGALTPAFASRAVLDGASPGPADDIFAAALVIYQVLTGRHAYNRLPANRLDDRAGMLERPAGLSNRQWRVLQAALALDASNRLTSMAALHEGLFGKSALWIQVAVGALCTVALGVTGAYLWQTGELAEAQQQVVVAAAEAKVEERHDRIVQLLAEPTFDASWEQQVAAELTRLAALPESGALYNDTKAQVARLYTARVIGAGDLDTAAALLDRGLRFGELDAAQADLAARFANRLDGLLAAPKLTNAWLGDVEQALIRRAEDDSAVAAVTSAYLALLADDRALPDSPLVQSVLALLRSRNVDPARLAAAERGLQRNLAARETRAAYALALRDARAQLGSFAPPGCGLPAGNAGEPVTGQPLRPGEPGIGQPLKPGEPDIGQPLTPTQVAALDEVASRCATALVAEEPASAAVFRRAAVAAFGPLPQLLEITIDPCLQPGLEGAGAEPGSYCRDLLGAQDFGLQLVVVPGAAPTEPAYAISRYELSWQDYDAFCRATSAGGCIGPGALAVADLDVATVDRFAAWLSEQTGFRYRLPTLSEWRWAATGDALTAEPDPNRNCRLELAGVVRGGAAVAPTLGAANQFGLVNVLGNLQEWVRADGRLWAVGGHYEDLLEDCNSATVRAADGRPSRLTGVRLVRELSQPGAGR